jgi:hypothetical protein
MGNPYPAHLQGLLIATPPIGNPNPGFELNIYYLKFNKYI